MPLSPSPQRQSVVSFPTPNVNDILFFESVDAERVGTDIPEYGTKHPDYKKWPDHRLVHVESSDDQTQGRYYRYYYAADQLNQDEDNWSFSKADIGGTKFDAVTRNYVVRRSEFNPETPAMGAEMPDVPVGKFPHELNEPYVLAEHKQVPLNDKVLNGLYVIEQRVYVKKVPLTRLDFDEFFKTTNKTRQILYYKTEVPNGLGVTTIEQAANTVHAYWGMNSGTVRTVQQLSDNWYVVTEQEVVKCTASRASFQTTVDEGIKNLVDPLVADLSDTNTNTNISSYLDLFSTREAWSAEAAAAASVFGNLPILIRNTSCWAHNLKGITGFVAWNNRPIVSEQRQFGGALITSRHVLVTGHAPYWDGRTRGADPPTYEEGDIVYFCSKDNQVYERTVLSTVLHSKYEQSGLHFDYAICLLDSALPPSITPLKVLPKDGYKYFETSNFTNESWAASTSASEEVLVMRTDQNANAYVHKIQALEFGGFNYDNPDPADKKFTLNTSSYGLPWGASTNAGDSGGPVTMVIDGECVLIGLISTGGPNPTGAFLGAPRNFIDINELITSTDAEYKAVTFSDAAKTNVDVTGLKLSPFDLTFDYTSHIGAAYQANECARLRYETVVNYAFPPILQGVAFDVWNMKSGGARTYPRVLYTKGAFRGPCKATVDISWSPTQPAGIEIDEKPAPEPFALQNPMFSLSIPPTLHTAQTFLINVGTEDETWKKTTGVFPMEKTNVTEWNEHIISSEVKPFRGGWVLETITVHPPV